MKNTIKQTIENYYTQFQNAQTIEDKQNIAGRLRAYYEGLDPETKQTARQVLQPFLDALKQRFEDLNHKTQTTTFAQVA